MEQKRGYKVWMLVLLLLGMALLVTILGAGWMIRMPGRSHRGPLPPLTSEEAELRDRLKRHVEVLAGEIGERNLWRYAALEKAVRYLEATWQRMGYDTAAQEFTVGGKTVKNLEVESRGTSHPDEMVVVGGHYDSVMGAPGANDNGTGMAAVLEISRLLAGRKPARTMRFVAFVNEEPPFFQTGAMGSFVYARRSRQRGEKVVAMLSLETIGFYADEPGSQQYPFPFSLFYPSTGNFIGFVGNIASRKLVHRAIASFRRHTTFPSEGLAAPGWITGIGWSDQWSFWQEGYPAIMITDTAPFRYPDYHTPQDTPARVDYDRLARVVAGLARVVEELGEHGILTRQG